MSGEERQVLDVWVDGVVVARATAEGGGMLLRCSLFFSEVCERAGQKGGGGATTPGSLGRGLGSDLGIKVAYCCYGGQSHALMRAPGELFSKRKFSGLRSRCTCSQHGAV